MLRTVSRRRSLPDVVAQGAQDVAHNNDPPPYTGDPMAANARLRVVMALLYFLIQSAYVAHSDPATFAAEQEDAHALIKEIRMAPLEWFVV